MFVLLEERFKSGKANGKDACGLDCQATEIVVIDLVPLDTGGRYKTLDLFKVPD